MRHILICFVLVIYCWFTFVAIIIVDYSTLNSHAIYHLVWHASTTRCRKLHTILQCTKFTSMDRTYLGNVVIHASTETHLMGPLHDIGSDGHNRDSVMGALFQINEVKLNLFKTLALLTVVNFPSSNNFCGFVPVHL